LKPLTFQWYWTVGAPLLSVNRRLARWERRFPRSLALLDWYRGERRRNHFAARAPDEVGFERRLWDAESGAERLPSLFTFDGENVP
jgi:hypothetical protein